MLSNPSIVIIPGNGNSHIETDNWYASVRDALEGRGYQVTATDMPDPELARRKHWEPYIKNELVKGADTIIIGHSSGAVATLRYLESHPLFGAVLVGCNYTHLDDPTEQESGWYNEPWQWEKIKNHAGWITQFTSPDDPFIPMQEVEYIHQQLGSELVVIEGRGHFMTDHSVINKDFPELVELITTKVKSVLR